MADVERERVTALWREASAALDQGDDTRERIARGLRAGRDRRRGDERDYDYRRALAVDGLQALDTLAAECGRLREQLDAARREVESQMQSKLDAQVTLKAVTEDLDLPFNELGNGWRDAAPKILARIETIVDEADRAFRERDAARAALGVEGEQEKP